MRSKPKYVLARKLVGHSAMGGSLGMLLALLLLNSHAPPFNDALIRSSNSIVSAVCGSFVIAFALGALLTGFTFIMHEENREG